MVYGTDEGSTADWEWCADWYDQGYYATGTPAGSSSSNPAGPTSGTGRVLRGGSWYNRPPGCQVAFRDYDIPGYRSRFVGFRVLSQ